MILTLSSKAGHKTYVLEGKQTGDPTEVVITTSQREQAEAMKKLEKGYTFYENLTPGKMPPDLLYVEIPEIVDEKDYWAIFPVAGG